MDGPDIDGIKEQDARRGELKQGPAESEDHRDDAGDAYRIAAQAVLGGVGEQIGWDVMPGQETVTYGWPIRDGYVARLRFQNDVLVDVNLDTGITLVAMDPALSNVRLDPTLVGYRVVK